MTAATFRLPGPLAISVAQVDQMSGGRVELGIGAGWFEAEHTAYGIPFPSLGERFDRYEEQLAVLTGLWNTPPGETFDFDGQLLPAVRTHRRCPSRCRTAASRSSSAARAGSGRRGWPPGTPPSSTCRSARRRTTRGCSRGVRQACEEAGRDPSSLVYSSALVLCVGKDEAEIARRAAAIGREVDELREHGVAGTPAEAVDVLGRYAEAGAQRFYLQVLDLSDLDHLDLVAGEVAPQLG